MKIQVQSISANRDIRDATEAVEVTIRGVVEGLVSLPNLVGEIYIYPKSRWGMFIDRWLK